MPRRRGYGKTGAGFWEDLYKPDRWLNEIINSDSDSQKFYRALQAMGLLDSNGQPNKEGAGVWGSRGRNGYGRARVGGFDWGALADPNKWMHEIVNPDSFWNQHLNRGAQVIGSLSGGRGRGKPRGPSRRGAIVRQVMQQHPNMTMPQASAFVKQHGLF